MAATAITATAVITTLCVCVLRNVVIYVDSWVGKFRVCLAVVPFMCGSNEFGSAFAFSKVLVQKEIVRQEQRGVSQLLAEEIVFGEFVVPLFSGGKHFGAGGGGRARGSHENVLPAFCVEGNSRVCIKGTGRSCPYKFASSSVSSSSTLSSTTTADSCLSVPSRRSWLTSRFVDLAAKFHGLCFASLRGRLQKENNNKKV